MNKEEIESLFKKYKVRIPKEKQGQSECHECKRHNKYSLTWTSFLYEYKENYYCFEHILIILLQQENKKYKEVIDKVSSQIKLYGKYDGEKCTRCFSMMTADFNKLLDILKEVSE